MNSIWKATARERNIFPTLSKDIETDICIVGGGITGLTLARELTNAGKEVVLLEAISCGEGTTSYSSNHLNTQIDYSYQNVVSKYGTETAKLVAESRSQAIDYIEHFSKDYDFDFKRVPGFLYAEYEEQVSTIEKEYETTHSLGMPVKLTDYVPLPFQVKKAVQFDNQAEFNTQKYLNSIIDSLRDTSCQIYENSRVKHYKHQDKLVKTENGSVKADHVVLATHLPLFVNLHQTTSAPYRSYMIVAKVEKYPPHGLYWDNQDPYHYTRIYEQKDEKWLVVGGSDHKTGEADPKTNYYQNLEKYIDQHFSIKEIIHQWSAQYYEPADGLPYIGKTPLGNTWMATGYSGDGLVYGTIAGMLIKDLITGNENKLAEVYSPKRMKPLTSGEYYKENIKVGVHFIKDRFTSAEFDKVPSGEGQIINDEGKSYAVYKEEGGDMHITSAVCPHIGCVVKWNHMEKTWDCPCHGSRFNPQGELIIGPATHNLEKGVFKKH